MNPSRPPSLRGRALADLEQLLLLRQQQRSDVSPDQRGIDLLAENLTAQQCRQFLAHGYFDVVGGESGKRYRIWHRLLQNVEEFDTRGIRVSVWCFHPSEAVPLGDVLLAQKTALELFEPDASRIAHKHLEFASAVAPHVTPSQTSSSGGTVHMGIDYAAADLYYRLFHNP